jgi:hypothetical protein
MKLLYIILVLGFSLSGFSQVGINTQVPQGILHIDPQSDTSGINNVGDDIIVTQDGNIGLGTIAPATKLHIVSNIVGKGFALQDGTQNNNYILVSDNDGNASWVESEVSQFSVIPQVTSGAISFTGNTYTYDPGLRLTFAKEGTYSLSIWTRLVLNRSASDVPLIKVQFVPVGSSNKYIGSAQVVASYISSTIYHEAYINQNIEVTSSTGLTARLEFSISGQFSPASGMLQAMWKGTHIKVK